jgi:hypothetical protein
VHSGRSRASTAFFFPLLADLTTKRRFVLKEGKRRKKYVAGKKEKKKRKKKDRFDNVARYTINVLRTYTFLL